MVHVNIPGTFRLLRLLKLGRLVRKYKKQIPFIDQFVLLGFSGEYAVLILLCSHYVACIFRMLGDQGGHDNAAAKYFATFHDIELMRDCTPGGACEPALWGRPWLYRQAVKRRL